MRAPILRVSEESLERAAGVVRGGGLVIYPTDTVYGLGCNPFDEPAVTRLLKVKGRVDKPLPILVGSLEDAAELAELSTVAYKVVERYWPGALTLVVRAKVKLPGIKLGSVGLRMPGHRVALKLIRLCGGSLVGTSANISGMPSPLTAEEAASQLGDKVDLIIDGGRTSLGLSSTVLDLTGDRPKVLRAGPVAPAELLRFLCVE
ncbi:MAG: L-threonylcarbamoyladenylate synthase [Candidatus Bathyarchaeia archaeon]